MFIVTCHFEYGNDNDHFLTEKLNFPATHKRSCLWYCAYYHADGNISEIITTLFFF